MSANTTAGAIAVYKNATGIASFELSRELAGVRCRQIPQNGITVKLPDGCNDGEGYEVITDNSCDEEHPVVIQAPAGQTIRGNTEAFLEVGFGSARLVLDEDANDWDFLVYAPQGFLPINAGSVSFSPGETWHTTVTNVSDALDSLMTPNELSNLNGGPLTGASVDFGSDGSGDIRSTRSGRYLVVASLSGTASVDATVTAKLQLDGADLGPQKEVPALAGGSWGLALAWIGTVADTALHTFNIHGAASAGSLTVPTEFAQIVIVEL